MKENCLTLRLDNKSVGVFYRQIFGSGRTPLGAKINHSRDTRFLLVRTHGKRVKALRLVATSCIMYSARLRVQDGYAYKSFDDYN